MENTATITKTAREYRIRQSGSSFFVTWQPINAKTGRGWNASHYFIDGADVAVGTDPRPRNYSSVQIATAAILAESK